MGKQSEEAEAGVVRLAVEVEEVEEETKLARGKKTAAAAEAVVMTRIGGDPSSRWRIP